MTSMELQRPRTTLVLPHWDLGIVPEALSKPPYEPLREACLKHLTLKTVFLLAMTSARRQSELKALVFDPQYIQFKPKRAGVMLYFTPGFMRKNQRTKSMTRGTFQLFGLVSQILVLLIAQLECSGITRRHLHVLHVLLPSRPLRDLRASPNLCTGGKHNFASEF